jgi:hypothetical protein
LLGLRRQVALADDLAVRIQRILTADVDGFGRAADADDLRERWVLVEPFRTQILHRACHVRLLVLRVVAHLHVGVAALEFVQHLYQALLHGFFALGSGDPADVVVLLIGGAAFVQPIRPRASSASRTKSGMGYVGRCKLLKSGSLTGASLGSKWT